MEYMVVVGWWSGSSCIFGNYGNLTCDGDRGGTKV